MENVKLSVNGHILTLTIDLAKRLGPSKSGKTEMIATTEGNVDVNGHAGVRLGLNCYTALKK